LHTKKQTQLNNSKYYNTNEGIKKYTKRTTKYADIVTRTELRTIYNIKRNLYKIAVYIKSVKNETYEFINKCNK